MSTTLDWPAIASAFHIAPARDLLLMERMARHQDVRRHVRWMTASNPPLALIFVSHRWDTLSHPDPDSRQLHAIQAFLQRVCVCIEAMMVSRPERLALMPSLRREGALQAEEVARRILGFGPFGDGLSRAMTPDARATIVAKFEQQRESREQFRDWLAGNIGVWLDYTCMPQHPLLPEEVPQFTRALGALDSLVSASTVVALRSADDDYPTRGWCAMEFFVGSERSFARGLFIDANRLDSEDVFVPVNPGDSSTSGLVAETMGESYAQDLASFEAACDQWLQIEGPVIQSWAPDAWSSYRSLQGSGFFALAVDPNPFRRAMDAIRQLETFLIEQWFMSDETQTIDLATKVRDLMEDVGLHCSKRADLLYVGMLLSCHGWIDSLRPMLREAFTRAVQQAARAGQSERAAEPELTVSLKPLESRLRDLFFEVAPSSARTWNSRLSSKNGHDARERAVISQLLAGLAARPPEYVFIDLDGQPSA
jgi:hypothetical protein